MKRIMLALAVLALGVNPVAAQDVVKIGQLEAQTGVNAVYGWMSSQGVALAVHEINNAGGFKVGDRTYTLQLIAPDNRGDPKEATVQLKRLLEVERVKYVFGPFLSNVFMTVRPYAQQFNGKFLMMGGAMRFHDALATPGHDFLLHTMNWDVLPGGDGFGELMADYLVKTTGAKKVAMLFQNDQGGKAMGDLFVPMFKKRGVETRLDFFEPGTKDFSSMLAKIAAWKPDFLSPGYADSYVSDIVRQATEGGQIKKFFLLRGSLGPGLRNKDAIEDFIIYVPKYFEEAEKKDPKVQTFIKAYKEFYKRDFPYDQAPLCFSACYDHVYMLVEAMKKAGTVDDVAAVKKQLMIMRYEGLWKIRYDERGEAIIDFDVVHLKKGGAVHVIHVNP